MMLKMINLIVILLLFINNNVIGFKNNNVMKRISLIKTNTNFISNKIEHQVNHINQ